MLNAHPHRLLAVAALLMILAVAAANAVGATFHVAMSGDDNAAGTEAAPWRTIQKAVAIARAGDAIVVHGGTYTGHVIFRHSGQPDKPIVLKPAPGQRPVFDGEGKGRIELKSQQGWQKPIGWIIVEGFEIRNGWDGIKFYNAHHIVLRDNHIHSNLNQGILGNGHHVCIEGNVIARNGFKADNQRSNLEHGIYCTGTDFVIVNNVIHSNKAYGIQVAGYPYNPENHPGPEFADARRWLISNNTLALNQNRAGIVIWQSRATDCVIQNNIFYKNSVSLHTGASQGIDFVSAGGGHMIRNNLFFAPGRKSIGDSGEFNATDNIEQQDPQFIEPESFDFRLQPHSPAIDAGVSENAPTTDRTGTTRPQRHAIDIGAHERPE
jgi:hypothetical protein